MCLCASFKFSLGVQCPMPVFVASVPHLFGLSVALASLEQQRGWWGEAWEGWLTCFWCFFRQPALLPPFDLQ